MYIKIYFEGDLYQHPVYLYKILKISEPIPKVTHYQATFIHS